MIDDYTERHYPFEGCFNFRDIGGYFNQDGQRIKKGLYFRTGRQDRMTDRDLLKLSELKISTQIDLRKPDEVADQGKGPLEAMGAKYINIAVIPEGGSDQLSRLVGDTGISGKRYLGYLEFGPTSWLRLFGILADESNLPVVLHCTAGKDRTGVSTAFLLSILGVSRDVIEEDYLLTNKFFKGPIVTEEWRDTASEKLKPLFEARVDYINAAFKEIYSTHETIEDFVIEELKLNSDTIDILKSRILE